MDNGQNTLVMVTWHSPLSVQRRNVEQKVKRTLGGRTGINLKGNREECGHVRCWIEGRMRAEG